jgi:glutathione S-transferase
MPLTFYCDDYFISPYAFSVFVALEEKRVAYRLERVALQRKEHHAADYLAASVTGRVPIIDHDGFTLAESSAIIDYLDEAFPAPEYARVLPEGIRERARARMVMHWIRSDLMPLREERPTTTMFYARAEEPLGDAGQAAARRLVEVAGRLLPEEGDQLFSRWTVADADLAFMLQRLGLNGHPLPPKLRAYVDRQWSRPSVQNWVTKERPPFEPY